MRPAQEKDVFHAIAHSARRTILVALREGEKPASALAEPFGVSFSAISQHLKILKDADLVAERREGRQRIYHLNSKPLKDVWNWIEDFQREWSTRLDALEAHLDKKHGKGKRTTEREAGRDARNKPPPESHSGRPPHSRENRC